MNKKMTRKKVALIQSSKIEFIKKGNEIVLLYNRKKKALLVQCIDNLLIKSILFHFTKENDRTILYQSVMVKLIKGEGLVSDLTLPENFDIYSPFSTKYKFSYKEENEKRKSHKNINK